SFTSQSFQVGANQGETIDIAAITDANIDSLGSWTSVESTGFTQTQTAAVGDGALAASFEINGVTVGVGAEASRTPAAAVEALRAAFDTAKEANASALANVTMADDGSITSTDETLTIGTLTNVTGLATAAGTETTIASEPKNGFADLDISTVAG